MMKNNLTSVVFLKKKVKMLKRINKRWAWRVGRLYYTLKSYLFIYKFNLRFFKFPMYIFKKFNYLHNSLKYFAYVYQNFLTSHKHLYGNSENMLALSDVSDDRNKFFYLSKKNLYIGAKSGNIECLFTNVRGLTFFSYTEPIYDLSDLSDFFYKGSIYGSLICELDEILYEQFLFTYDLNHNFEFNLVFVYEIYKINVMLTLSKLINLYF